jgi:predicted alpha-1,2-mannosidase
MMRLSVAALAAVIACLIGAPAAVSADHSGFATSFEASDAPPTWVSAAERAGGVTGPKRSGIPGNVTDTVVAVTASGENTNGGEVKENLVDGSPDSKWLVFERTGWVAVELAQPVKVVRYALTSANDADGRDPKDWTLQGSPDGQSWTTLDTQTGQDFSARFQTKEYSVANATAYKHYRLNVLANHGEDIVQLAELQLSDGQPTPPPAPVMQTQVGSGPAGGYNAKSRAGWTGLRALRYAGEHTAAGRGYSYNKVYDVDLKVRRDTELSYLIYPDFERGDLRYPSTYAAVDLRFTDGTYLSSRGAVDQHGATLSPTGQGASKTLYTNQWNFKRSRIGAVAAGKRIDKILVAYDNPAGPGSFGGWIDDIRIGRAADQPKRERRSDWVVTTRGTNSSGSFSRGNNIPATAVPHGFNFWVPETNAGTLSWLYEYQKDNNADNLPTLEAFAASHEPSPWMGDRQTFQVMPSPASAPDTGRDARKLPFRHANEVAKPHYYGVTFENGLKTEIAPTDHAAIMRFTFPGSTSSLIFDNVNDNAGLTIDQARNVVTGYSDVRSGLSNGATRLYVYATFDRPIKAVEMSGKRTGSARFDAREVTMRIATSLISVEQAEHNLELELGARDSLRRVARRAQRQWDDVLGKITVQGATDDQKTTLYSNLYRLSLYPNSAAENVGSAQRPVWKHKVQSSTETHDDAPVVDGKVYVNNGFWDTYRTTWSAYSLLYPRKAGELVDGFVQQYRDGGWIARWSSPGYANLMTGTSSDAAFADALVKGVRGFDGADAYAAAVKNATVAPPGDPLDPSVGRKGLFQSLFQGYTSTRVDEGVSWALEGDINDYGIGNMARALADATGDPALRRRYLEESEYFLARATNYVNMFDPRIGFFQGRGPDGKFKSSPAAYDPEEWGHARDYTETDGWNFAFLVPHDGQGLANLYGGRAGLAAKLDTFFATPETAEKVGSYGGVIHEMIEARDVRMGQWGFSNQVSHHIPYMYDYAGQPWKAQEKVREVLRRLYVGSEIGQGYGGDEDNGETSAWYVFSALGFYPLQVGSDYYAIGSPLFERAIVRLDNGRTLVVRANHNSARNVYVQGLRLNGRRYDKAYLRHADIANGGTLEFDMGPTPSRWGTGPDAVPPSLTQDGDAPKALQDVSQGAGALSDDDSSTEATVDGPLTYDFAEPQPARFYTLTNSAAGADPTDWVVEGSSDGTTWKALDERHGETFAWRTQTRPFKLAAPGAYSHYRIRFSGSPELGEVELLNPQAADLSPLSSEPESAVGSAGETVTVKVRLTNYGEQPASGEVTANGPEGFAVTPAAASFGPLAHDGSQVLSFQVAIPASAAPGTYAIALGGSIKDWVTVTVIGDTIEFAPNTDAEAPWLIDADGSQIDVGRFTDGSNHATYRFPLPAGISGGTLTIHIGNQYKIESSTDGENWTVQAVENAPIRDRSNLADRSFDLNALREGGRTVYLRLSDSQPADGWGGWWDHVKVTLQR